MIDPKLIVLREHKDSDIPYIYSSWMEDYLAAHWMKKTKDESGEVKKSNPAHVAMMPKSIYFKEIREVINGILGKSEVTVACNIEDQNQIFGYAVHRYNQEVELGLISWIYVRPIYRGLGISSIIMAHLGVMHIVSHVNPSSRWFLKKHGLIYNPFMERK